MNGELKPSLSPLCLWCRKQPATKDFEKHTWSRQV
jgi:hypothetical protein